MNTKRLSDSIEKALNGQLTKEAQAAEVYLSYGTWADENGYSGIANFLYRHASEERNHMMKVLEYIQNRGGRARITAIPAPGPDPQSIQDCFEKVFQHEVDNTTAIYAIAQMSMQEQDWATWNFMQWFVKEQVEEETLALQLLDRIKIAGGKNAQDDALLQLDRELKDKPDDAPAPETATAENP
ncbi:MAG: ferritin [Chitinophagaceae bacterium]